MKESVNTLGNIRSRLDGWGQGGDIVLQTTSIKQQGVGDSSAIHHFHISHNTLCLPPKFCISIVFNFSRDNYKSQGKLKTMLIQNFGGQTKSVVANVKVVNGCQLPLIHKSEFPIQAMPGYELCHWWTVD